VSDNATINGLASSQPIRGVVAPVLTPFKADLAPDSQRFIAHCKRLLSQNCGLAVFGTNSEANSLSIDVLNAVAPGPRFTARDALS
jgi:dihydrodipicolinate synthase/N-acetylneuraminate lyase